MGNQKWIGVMVLLAFSASVVDAQDAMHKPSSQSEAAPASEQGAKVLEAKSATGNANYIIGPEDELSINVWREPDISHSVPVRPDGKISLPLLNDIQASGLTPMQLSAEITDRLKKFISDPQVTIIVNRVNSQRIYLLGEVGRAGAYPLVPNMTVLEALSSAGGCTIFAKQTKIYILRLENGKEVRLPFNYKEVLAGQRMTQNILLKSGDTIVVP